MYSCNRCSYEASSKVLLIKHLKTNNICEAIKENIDRNIQLDELIKIDLNNLNDLKHICKFCGKYFNFSSSMYLHKQSCKTKIIETTTKICLNENCNTYGNSKYKGYCLRCFIYIFPDEPILKNYKVKERHIKDYLKIEFPNKEFINDRKIIGGCSQRRPDFYLDCLTHILIIEIDENCHKNYDCENKRMMQLFLDSGSIPCVFIRFNPDSYIDETGKKIESCFTYHKKLEIPIIKDKNKWQDRLQQLKYNIQYYTDNIPTKEITIKLLYYDYEY